MRTISYSSLGTMAVLMTVVLSGQAKADEGVVRITDNPATARNNVRPVSTSYSTAGYGYYGNGYCDDCQQCEGDSCECKKCCKGCYPADAGWGRPMRNPIYRIPVSYLKRWPDAVSGNTASGAAPVYPMVYQPTDTTQLGFTYQVAPRWQANPAMLPPMPWPNQWHSRECGYRGCCGNPNCDKCLFGNCLKPVEPYYGYNSYGNSYEVVEPTTVVPAEQPKSGPTEIPAAPPVLDKSASQAPVLKSRAL